MDKNKNNNLIKENKFLLLSFIIPATILFIVYALLGIFPFGEKSVLITDGATQYIDFFTAYRRMILEHESMLFSWSNYFGGNMLGIIAYYLSSPFSIIVALFPEALITEAVFILTLIKIGLCGFTFAIYMKKSFKLNRDNYKLILFSSLYALMGYTMVYTVNIMWLDGVIFLPIIILGIENIVDSGKYKLYTIFLALTLISTYYIGFMICIFAVVYFIYYYLRSNNKLHFKEIFNCGFKFGAASILAASLAAVILLPAYFSLKTGKMSFSLTDFMLYRKFDILDVLPKTLAATYDSIKYNGLPNVYSGLICLFLVPVYFINKNIRVKDRFLSAILLAILFFSMNINTLNTIWHAFKIPQGFPYRFSFIFSFVVISLAYKGFEGLEEIDGKNIINIYGIIILLLIIIGKFEYWYISDKVIYFNIALISIYAILLYLFSNKKNSKAILSLALVLIVLLESFVNSNVLIKSLNNEFGYHTRSSYTDFKESVKPIIEKIENEDDDFYRIEKTFQRSINDSLSLGYRGISTFSSSFDQSMLDYLYAMGSESFFYISIYNGATIVFDSLMSVKYVLSHDEINKYYEAIAEENGITTYYNPYVLPLGFMVNNDLTNVEIIAGNPFKLQNEILSSMIGNYEKEYFSPLEIINISYENLMVEENEETTSYSKIDKNYEGIINLDVKVNSNYPLYSYFSVNDHFYNFFVDVNGKTVSNVSGAINDLGQYKEGETINIRVRTNDDFTMDNYHVYSLDMDKFAEAYNELNKNPLNIIEYGDTYILGTISADKDGLLYTSVPYSDGWTVFVDGEKVEKVKILDSLIGIELKEGDHDIEFKYSAPGFRLGLVISIVGVIILIVLTVFEKRKLKNK